MTALPKRQEPTKRGRVEVVRRKDHYDFSSHMNSEEHGWAVSYADLLMVLLSFFVIFFSIGSDQKDNLILQIMKGVNGTAQGGTASGSSTAETKTNLSGTGFSVDNAQRLAEIFKGLSPQVQAQPVALTVHFPDELFERGGYKLNAKSKKQFDEFVHKLKPFAERIEVVITGHADQSGVRSTARFVDNFELSSLRALSALREAKNLGLPESIMRARAASSNERGVRSISVWVQAK